MIFTLWHIVIGAILISMALAASVLRRAPLSTSILYMGVGIALGPVGFGLLQLDPLANSALLERLTEVAVIISLFAAGLKLRMPLLEGRWRVAVRLAFGSMAITVGLIALVGVGLLGLPVGAAILLGAVLAPTDPVLASDVQVRHVQDRDRLRFSLTGEAGLNDGTAFPFVMLGLGLLGLHEIGEGGWRWLAVDVIWAILAGLGIGWLLGMAIGRLIVYLRREYKESVGLDDFLALGLIAFSYGVALLAHAYGFLAVFAAGLAVRRIERLSNEQKPPEAVMVAVNPGSVEEVATDPEKAPAYMAQAMLGFSEHLERMGQIGVVMLVGAMLHPPNLAWEAIWVAPLLFLAIRPTAVTLGLLGSDTPRLQRTLMGWFGVRGIGSIYYLMYAIQHGLPPALAQQLTALTLTIVAVSIVVHGISVTPMMNLYQRAIKRRYLRRLSPVEVKVAVKEEDHEAPPTLRR